MEKICEHVYSGCCIAALGYEKVQGGGVTGPGTAMGAVLIIYCAFREVCVAVPMGCHTLC